MADDVVIRSFAGGELSPTLGMRADLAKYTIGLKTCRNFLVHRHGGVSNRPGTRFINACKTDDIDVKLIPYVSEVAGESMLIEHGEGYFRFYLNGALVQVSIGGLPAWSGATEYFPGDLVASGGLGYYCRVQHTNHVPPNATYWYPLPADGTLELPSPFNNPRETHSVQSGRTIAFTHPDVRPHDLLFLSTTQWAIVPVATAPKVAAPTGLVLTVAGGGRKFGYIVTAAHPVTYEESLPSAQVINAACADPTTGAPHHITWNAVLTPAVTGVASPEYYVYCDPYGNGTYGFIGTATAATGFYNPGIAPDFTQTPQLPVDAFDAANEYPSTVGFHQQRRFFANTHQTPDGIFASRVGYLDNFGISSPLQDDDALAFRIAGNNQHAVRHLVGLKRLIVMTDGGEWGIGNGLDPLTPNNIPADQETYVGIAPNVAPVVIGNSILYVQARQRILRQLQFTQAVEGFAGKDLTIYADHLFRKRQMNAIAFQQNPDPIVWACRNDGVLLGLTYDPEQDLWAWHRHDTGASGRFEDVCVVPELDDDVPYFIVRRTIGGVTKRYIEKLESREIEDWSLDSFFLDSGLTYAGGPVSSVSGLSHLEGQTVGVVGDGAYWGTRVVSGGTVALGGLYSVVHVGLLYTPELETLALDVAGSSIRAKQKTVQSVALEIADSARGFQVGQPDTTLVTYAPRSTESPLTISFTGQVEVRTFSRGNQYGRVKLLQPQPLPLTVLGLVPSIDVGD